MEALREITCCLNGKFVLEGRGAEKENKEENYLCVEQPGVQHQYRVYAVLSSEAIFPKRNG